MSKPRALLVGLWVVAATWGTAAPVTAGRAPTSRPAVKSAAPKSDAAIEQDIRARLAKSKIGTDGFQVHVQGGVATLDGKTDVLQHKGVATRLAKSAGAAVVKNRIQISDAARQKAAKNLETGRRRVQVKRGEPRSDARTERSSH